MKRRKICVVVASRANYGRIRSLLREINKREDLELQLVVSASALLRKYGNVSDLIEKDGFRCSTAVGYLNPIKQRQNLKIITHAHIKKINFENKIAKAVEYCRTMK